MWPHWMSRGKNQAKNRRLSKEINSLLAEQVRQRLVSRKCLSTPELMRGIEDGSSTGKNKTKKEENSNTRNPYESVN